MSDRLNLPPDEVMREMAKLAMQQAAHFFADYADRFASTLGPEISGSDALTAFARAIRSTEGRINPVPTVKT